MKSKNKQRKLAKLVKQFTDKEVQGCAQDLFHYIDEVVSEHYIDRECNYQKVCEREGWKIAKVSGKGIVLLHKEAALIYKPFGEEQGNTEPICIENLQESLESLEKEYFFEEVAEKDLWEEFFEYWFFLPVFYRVSDLLAEKLREKEQPVTEWQGVNIWVRRINSKENMDFIKDKDIVEIVKEFYNL